jgi:hypothetical protein
VRHNKLEGCESPRWAELADLKAEVLSHAPNPRSLRRGREIFVDCYLQSEIVQTRDNLAQAVGRGRPHGTQRQGEPNSAYCSRQSRLLDIDRRSRTEHNRAGRVSDSGCAYLESR